MKIKYLASFILLLPMVLQAQNDSANFIHRFEKEGPIALQIIWIDNGAETDVLNNAITLKAALEGGTENHSFSAFKNLSADYRIEWETESANGLHRLSISFAQTKYELALALLNEVLNKTAFEKKAIEDWRKSELYHYNYYKNDPDTLIKWWSSKKEAYYLALLKNEMKYDSLCLLDLLGKPQIVSSVGRINETILKRDLTAIVKTEKRDAQIRVSQTKDLKRSRASVHSFRALGVNAQNPVNAYCAFRMCRKGNGLNVNSSSFSWFASTGSVNLKRNFSFITETENDEFYLKKALVDFNLWLEFNKNEALANAMIQIEVWPKEIMILEVVSATLEDGLDKTTYYLGS